MNNSRSTLNEKMKIDEEIEEMKAHPVDYSDIPPRKSGGKVRLVNKEFLDKLPPDIVQELARRRLAELQRSGYELPAKENV
ncbi:hypothetical protein FACS189491_05350 [Spirochaetia bacterium]|nr:hypothetical protein FACS189491_05350 [Spirochaetia bacterium]